MNYNRDLGDFLRKKRKYGRAERYGKSTLLEEEIFGIVRIRRWGQTVLESGLINGKCSEQVR
jgi:hypothetical protein